LTREVAVADGQDETTLYGFEQIGEFLELVERDGVVVFAADMRYISALAGFGDSGVIHQSVV
jgi:hypothetical protein